MNKNNIHDLLVALDFTKDIVGDTWRRTFAIGTELCVDCTNEKFLYKDAGITVTTATTTNFAQPENFVVFECVCRLLAKGYQPKDIELEPAWKFGHNEKAARADIWIRTIDKSGKHSLLIIECKTAGREFDSAWRDTCEDGGQIFSYFHQEPATSFLCLYTSDLVEDKDGKVIVSAKYHLINVRDNEDYLKQFKKPKTYRSAENAKARFAAWRDTYQRDYAKVGLFESEIAPYKPGKNKYSLADLSEIDHASMQRKYNEFATILRQHNVSGRENAFDKLVNLFLAKVVDESCNGGELKFYWKGIAYDDSFSLQDRLQYLYMHGMKKFLNEDVTYIDEATVKKAFRRFEKDPDATKDTILEYFRKLKFFSNNDFAFIDVHNEPLFRKNAAILLKIVQMLEDIRLKTDKPNQFLGDLFEGFLDRGVKQSEGQFFTPLPIVRFIISSLPLQEIVRDGVEPPHVIDYACGAGHFLNEYAQQVKNIVRNFYSSDSREEASHYAAIVGVEKEYRLSKVAKVAAFMYGEDDIQIVCADSLAQNDKMPEGAFDILVANPPYSVKGFLETLSEKDRERYGLTAVVGKNLVKQDSIESFFVERAVQLLKSDGIAAIILPSSILSNSDGVSAKCREIILENFDIIALAGFEKGTFGKTNMSTVAAFMRKKESCPCFADHWRNRVNAWFEAKYEGDEVFCDASALERYCAHRKFDILEYRKFLAGKLPEDAGLWQSDAFKTYYSAFAKIKQPKNVMPRDLARHKVEYVREQEKERLYFFLLADANPVDVLVVTMPSETKSAKAYLGYEWSTSKGYEGIKYLGVDVTKHVSPSDDNDNDDDDDTLIRIKGIENIKTPLFNNADLFDPEKLNSLIRLNFKGAIFSIPNALQPFAKRISLVNMLNFEAAVFNKEFNTVPMPKFEPLEGYIQYKLSDEENFSISIGRRVLGSEVSDTFRIPVYSANVNKPFGMTEKPLKELEDFSVASILWGIDGDWMVSYISEKQPFYPTDHCGVLRVKSPDINPKYLSFILYEVGKRVGFKRSHRASTERVRNLVINLPPLRDQEKVVSECAKVDEEFKTSRMTVKEYRTKIAKVFDDLGYIMS